MSYCVNCGAELNDDSRFCPNCGVVIDDGGEPVTDLGDTGVIADGEAAERRAAADEAGESAEQRAEAEAAERRSAGAAERADGTARTEMVEPPLEIRAGRKARDTDQPAPVQPSPKKHLPVFVSVALGVCMALAVIVTLERFVLSPSQGTGQAAGDSSTTAGSVEAGASTGTAEDAAQREERARQVAEEQASQQAAEEEAAQKAAEEEAARQAAEEEAAAAEAAARESENAEVNQRLNGWWAGGSFMGGKAAHIICIQDGTVYDFNYMAPPYGEGGEYSFSAPLQLERFEGQTVSSAGKFYENESGWKVMYEGEVESHYLMDDYPDLLAGGARPEQMNRIDTPDWAGNYFDGEGNFIG